MKKLICSLCLFFGVILAGYSQTYLNKDGSPDMRYKQNKQLYGDPYKNQNSSPRYNYNSNQNNYSTTPTYPTKKNGTPDMRYRENRNLYGNPYRNN